MVRKEITLGPRHRGFHEITVELEAGLPELGEFEVGLLHLMLLHTSASLTVTESASPDVLRDFESWFSEVVPESRDWAHSLEGPDDMPAHVRSVLTQTELTIPVGDGGLVLGTWQGIFLCEHRDRGGSRQVVATIQGERSEGRDGPADL